MDSMSELMNQRDKLMDQLSLIDEKLNTEIAKNDAVRKQKVAEDIRQTYDRMSNWDTDTIDWIEQRVEDEVERYTDLYILKEGREEEIRLELLTKYIEVFENFSNHLLASKETH